MKPIPTADNVVPELMRISHRLEQERIVHSDDAFWVGAGGLVIRNLQHNFQQAIEILNRTISERNEARRDACHAEADAYHTATAEHIAKERGWDCFESVTVTGEVSRAD